MIKKLIVFKLVFLLVFFPLLSYAALQWDVAAYIATGTAVVVTGLTIVAAAPIVIAGTIAVGFHAAVIGLYWNDASPPLLNNGQPAVRSVSVILDANTPLVIPSGYTAGSLKTDEPLPPPESTTKTPYKYDSFQFSSTNTHTIKTASILADLVPVIAADIHAYFTWATAVYIPNPELESQGGLTFDMQEGGVSAGYSTTVNFTEATCNSGYTLDTSYTTKCNLSDATLTFKPSDGMCEIRRLNGVFTSSSRDPDCQNTSITGSGTATLSAVTAGRAVYLATANDDKVSVYTKEYNEQSNQTITTVANLTSSQIVSLISQTVATGDTTAVSTVTGTAAGGGGSTTGSALDSSLNVQPGGDESVGISGSATQGVSVPVNHTENLLSSLRAWQVPSNSGTCPTANFSLFGSDLVLDKHCSILDANTAVIHQAMAVVFTISALFIVLGA